MFQGQSPSFHDVQHDRSLNDLQLGLHSELQALAPHRRPLSSLVSSLQGFAPTLESNWVQDLYSTNPWRGFSHTYWVLPENLISSSRKLQWPRLGVLRDNLGQYRKAGPRISRDVAEIRVGSSTLSLG